MAQSNQPIPKLKRKRVSAVSTHWTREANNAQQLKFNSKLNNFLTTFGGKCATLLDQVQKPL